MKRFVKHGIAIIGIAALVFLALGSAASTPSPFANKEFEALFDKGIKSYNRGDYNQAIIEFTEAIRLEPNYFGTYNNRAIVYDKINDLDRAIADWDKAIQLEPNDKDTQNNRNRAIAKRDRLAQTQTQTQAQPQAWLASTTPEPVKDDDFEVKQNPDNTLTITGYKGTARNVVIPDTLYGLKVTIIGNSAFQDKGLISVVIPDTVITIENGSKFRSGAFGLNKELIKVTLGKGIKTIGDRAFSGYIWSSTNQTGGQLTEIIIPDSVTRIGEHSFSYTGLTKVTLGTGLQSIGESAFQNNQITAEIILPSSLKEIGESAFRNNEIQKLTLGTGLQNIGGSAFRNNQITAEIILPSSLKEIGESAFRNNKIQKLTLGTGLQNIGIYAFSDNQIKELDFNLPSSLKTIANGTFANNQMQSVTIPNNITSLDSGDEYGHNDGAFANNPLTTVVIPASLANGYIDRQSFGSINGNTITRITLPVGMKEDTLRGLFEQTLVNFWISQNGAGGTYVKRGPIWTKE